MINDFSGNYKSFKTYKARMFVSSLEPSNLLENYNRYFITVILMESDDFFIFFEALVLYLL